MHLHDSDFEIFATRVPLMSRLFIEFKTRLKKLFKLKEPEFISRDKIKGKYRRRLQELTDENVQLRYELCKFKKPNR